jgi:hypothetical protein
VLPLFIVIKIAAKNCFERSAFVQAGASGSQEERAKFHQTPIVFPNLYPRICSFGLI